MGIAGNKADLVEEEKVDENEAREFAKSIGAFFRLTSAKLGFGINTLLNDLGKRYIDPNYIESDKDIPDDNKKVKKVNKKGRQRENNGSQRLTSDKKNIKKNKKCC